MDGPALSPDKSDYRTQALRTISGDCIAEGWFAGLERGVMRLL